MVHFEKVNKKLDIAAIEAQVDFESVSSRLESLAQSGELRKRKSVSDLLDRVRPALLKARESKVSFVALAAYLNENGIPVSEPTLRQYLQKLPGRKKPRKRKNGRVKPPVKQPALPAQNAQEARQEDSSLESTTSPRVARRS
jgi:hypothetical protein